jgi:hypothetical protein
MAFYVRSQLGETYNPDSRDENLIDMLTDLMHFATSDDIDFESSLRMAKINFEAEQNEEICHGI